MLCSLPFVTCQLPVEVQEEERGVTDERALEPKGGVEERKFGNLPDALLQFVAHGVDVAKCIHLENDDEGAHESSVMAWRGTTKLDGLEKSRRVLNL